VAQGARFACVRSLQELDAKLASAGRPAMLDCYADRCVSSRELGKFTFTDSRVKAKLGEMLLLQADVAANTPEDKALLTRFKLFGPPGIIFYDRRGKEI
jgi:thiol:disulfide interchange protein DsbD